MVGATLKLGCLYALLLAPAGALALTYDPAWRTGRGVASESTSPFLARYWRARDWRGHILPLDFQRHCPYGRRWEPFPTDRGYAYACVPWR